jgi:FixJ family two-component response regulator
MDGIELTREFLKLQPGLPIMVMTGCHDISKGEEATLTRASDFLSNPFSLMDLLTRFTKVMLNHR